MSSLGSYCVGLFFRSIVLPGIKILDVGFKAIFTFKSWPVEIPPSVPPEKLLKKPFGVISSLASDPFDLQHQTQLLFQRP